MKRYYIVNLIILLTILSVTLLTTACGADSVAPTPTVIPTPTVTPQPLATDTDESLNASSEITLQGVTVADLATVVANRPPVPTATPGPVDRAVKQVATRSGLVGNTFLGLSAEDWINVIVSAVVVLVGSLIIIPLLFAFLKWVVHRTATPLDDAFLDTIGRELKWLVVIYLASEAALRLEFWSITQRTTLDDFFFLLTLAVLTIIGFRLVTFAADSFRERLNTKAERTRWDSILVLLTRLGYLLVGIIALSFGLGQIGINFTIPTVLIFTLAAIIFIGARAAVTDAISGFLILIDRPFQEGDDILIKELDTWGKVLDIGIRSTRIYVYDNREVIVPNSLISESQFINYANPDPSFRVQIEFGVAYDTDIGQLRPVISKAVRGVEGVMPDKPVDVFFTMFGDSALQIRVRWWIESYNAQLVMTDRVNTTLKRVLRDAGIEIPYPIFNLNVKSNTQTAD
jgi:small-conductance mechanosensitive channel